MDGIVDAEKKTEVKERLRNAKEVLDEKEKKLLKKESSYRPLFSVFLDERRRMIAKTISLIRGKITADASVFNWHIFLVN